MGWFFNTSYPLWSVVVVAAAYLAVVVLVSRHPVLRKRKRLHVLLLALRTVVIIFIVLCLLNPSSVLPKPTQHTKRIVLLVDASQSMRLADATEPVTRFERALDLIRSTKLVERLSEEADVELVAFGHDAE